jgi:hypothetical protein
MLGFLYIPSAGDQTQDLNMLGKVYLMFFSKVLQF